METDQLDVGSSRTTDQTLDNDTKGWEIEKVQLEQANFNLNQDLSDVREKLVTVSRKNDQLTEELARSSTEVAEQTKARRALEATKNELSQRNINLESSASRLMMEKEERDNAITNLNKERQTFQVELFAVKDQLKQQCNEKAQLSVVVEALQQEKRTLAFEREKYSTENQIHAESKKWFMKEISERDNRISSLRMQLNAKDIELTNEKLQLESDVTNLKLQIEEFKDKLQLAKESNENLLARLEQNETAHNKQISDLEAELRCQAELADVLKNSLDEAKMMYENLRDELLSRDNTVAEVKRVLEEVHEEVAADRERIDREMNEKDEKIAQLENELSKSNEMLKNKHAVHVNITEAELAALSPAAADTARILKGGQSLTSIIKEHARLAGELAEARELNAQLEESFNELCERIQENVPHFGSQRNMLDASLDKNTAFESQLQDAERERQKLMNERDSASRELAFTLTELEKYQRDYERVTKQVHQLMFAAEREQRATDEEWNEVDDEKLYTTIVSLQQRNVQLESDIEHEKKSAAQAAMAAQNSEMAVLRAELTKSQEGETRLKSQLEQLKTALNMMKEQSNHFKELVKDSVTAAEARNARIKAEEAVAREMAAELKVERLENYVQVLKEQKAKDEERLNQRIEASESSASSIKQTNVRLEVMLETQKTLTAELQKEMNARQREFESARKEVEKLLAVDARRQQQISQLSKEMIEAKEESATCRVEKRTMEDELFSARAEIERLIVKSQSLQSVLSREQQVMLSLNEMSTRLARIEQEKQTHQTTGIDALRIERDSLKSSSARLSDQLTHLRNEAKLVQLRLESELNLVRTNLAEKDDHIATNERELIDLRSKLAAIQAQYTGADTAGMTPDRLKKECQQLKNRTQFLENQLDEAKRKLSEAHAERAKRDDEKALVESHSNVLEENFKRAEEMGAMERERLETKAKAYEERSDQLSQELAKLREEHELVKNELDEAKFEAEKEKSETQRQMDVANMQLEEIRRQKEEAISAANEQRTESQRRANELAELHHKMTEVNSQLEEEAEKFMRLRSELDNKTVALMAAQESARKADEIRESAEMTLRKNEAAREAIEKESREKLQEYESKLDNVVQKYVSLASTVSSHSTEGDTSMASQSGAADTSLLDASMVDTPNLIESLQNLLQFVREDKDKAVTRAMNAEVEMRRLRAETAEFERGRNELLTKIRDLEMQRAATEVALVEKAKLMEKVESLSAIQHENTQLSAEKARLTGSLTQLQREKVQADAKTVALTSKYNEMNMKMSSITNELNLRRREAEQLKQRLEVVGRGANAGLQTELEQLRSQLGQCKQQAEMANRQAIDAEKAAKVAIEKEKAATAKCENLRKIAIKYRDEATAKTQAGQAGGPSISTDENTQLQLQQLTTESEQLKEENEQLKSDLQMLKENNATLERASSEHEMQQIRMNMLESRLKAAKEETQNIMKENNELKKFKEQHLNALTEAPRPSLAEQSSAPMTPTGPLAASTPNMSPAVKMEPNTLTLNPSAQQQQHKPQFGVQHIPRRDSFPPAPIPFGMPPQTQRMAAEPTPPVQQSMFGRQPGLSVSHMDQIDMIPPVPSETVPDPTPPVSVPSFGSSSALPVPTTFQTSARVPTQTLFSSFGSEIPSAPNGDNGQKSVLPNISDEGSSSAPAAGNVTYSFATSSAGLVPGQSFGKSTTNRSNISTSITSNVTIDDQMALPEESVQEIVGGVPAVGGSSAGQSSHVSGSVDDASNKRAMEAELSANDGESRDSVLAGGVSSSDGRRKRGADDSGTNEVKRLRESPSEAVTSSESRQVQHNAAEIPELDEDVLEVEQEVSDEDANDTVRERPVVMENDEEVLGDDNDMEDDEEEDDDDESFGGDEEYEDPDDDQEDTIEGLDDVENNNDQIITLDSDDDDEDENVDADSLNDMDEGDDEDEEVEEIDNDNERGRDDEIEVLGGEDSQPSLDDQDREAASAIEEAEDEGRDPSEPLVDDSTAPADPTGAAASGVGSGNIDGSASQPDVPRLRMPAGLLDNDADRDDQCSSSNEMADASTASPSHDNSAQQPRVTPRQQSRVNRPVRGAGGRGAIYQPGALRGRGARRGGGN